MPFPGFPGLIDMYHLTGKQSYEAILNSRPPTILPFSHPYWKAKYNEGNRAAILLKQGVDFGRLNAIVRSDRYIVGFSEPVPRGWIDSGLMITLLDQKLSGSGSDCRYPLYSFKMQVNSNRVFVRDHYLTSPLYYHTRYGHDYWTDFVKDSRNFLANPDRYAEFWEGMAAYFNSTMPWSSYRGNYKCPELWFAGAYILENSSGVKVISERGVGILEGKI
jgi:hypothetical protein